MARSKTSKKSISKPGQEVYSEICSLSKKLFTDLLLRMIESAEDYDGWRLSSKDGTQLVKLLKQKRRALCSGYTLQLNSHFEEFKAGGKSKASSKKAQARNSATPCKPMSNTESKEMQNITKRYTETFKEFDRTLLKRLQACIKRSRANVSDNPLQVKRLCESYHHIIVDLKLESKFNIALYRLFADRCIESLGPVYRRIDLIMLGHGILPELPEARIQLRTVDDLSEAGAPAELQPDQSVCLLTLLQKFKENSRKPSSSYANLFPELKERFAKNYIEKYNEQIDQLNLIFKLIFEDEDLPSPIKQQLARLQIYVFITAIQEDGFLRRSTNPARRLLDGIITSEVEIAKSGNSDFSGIRFIREHINQLTNREFITVDSYTEMLKGYQSFLQQNEAATRNARKLEATRKITPVVKSRLNEIVQPLKIQRTPLILFEKVWLPLMVQIALQQGMNSDPWHKTIIMVKKQVWSLIPKSSRQDHQELLKTLPQVAHSLHRAMRSLKLAENLQQSLREYLKLQQQNVVHQTSENIAEAKRKTRELAARSFENLDEDATEFDALMQTGMFQVPTDMLEKMNSSKPKEPKKINQVEALTLGEWVNMMQDGVSILTKVAWKSEDSSLFIFVDREGSRVCEVDADELEKMFACGDVTLKDSAASTTDTVKSQNSFMKSL